MSFPVTIVTPTQKTTHHVEWLDVTVISGNMVLLSCHAPFMGIVRPSSLLHWKSERGKVESCSLSGGIMEVTRERVTIITDQT
jgi:F0F1-type ATP synthase epsilon subunit